MGTLSVAEGWATAADAVGDEASIDDITGSTRDAGWTTFRVSTLKGTQEGRKVAFATPKRGVRAAVETIVSDESGGSVSSYRQIVDAATGQILFRESTIDQAIDNPKWLVWEANPHAALDE